MIPKGDMLMVSPFWSHRNPKYFPEPDNFNPVRFSHCFKIHVYVLVPGI